MHFSGFSWAAAAGQTLDPQLTNRPTAPRFAAGGCVCGQNVHEIKSVRVSCIYFVTQNAHVHLGTSQKEIKANLQVKSV